MALHSGKLTKNLVRTLGPGRHGDGNGLYLVVDPSGARLWIVRVTVKGQRNRQGKPFRTDFGLGGADIVTLNQARDRALEYNTCGYSIENYCFDRDALRAVARKCYQLNLNDPIYVDLEAKIDNAFDAFGDVAKPIMSYIVGLRCDDQALDMDGLHFVDLFKFDETGLVSKEFEIENLAAKIGSSEPLTVEAFDEHQLSLAGEEIAILCRGKLISQFLLNFLKSVPKQFLDRNKANGRPLKSKLEIGKRNLILIFGEFIGIPARLKEFLERLHSDLEGVPD